MLPKRVNQVLNTLVTSTIAFVAVTVTTLTVGGASTFSGAVQANGGINASSVSSTALIVGQGTSVSKHVSSSFTINPDSIAGSQATSSVLSLTGAATGNSVTVTRPASWNQTTSTAIISGYVSATNQVTLMFINASTSALDLSSGSVIVDVWAH